MNSIFQSIYVSSSVHYQFAIAALKLVSSNACWSSRTLYVFDKVVSLNSKEAKKLINSLTSLSVPHLVVCSHQNENSAYFKLNNGLHSIIDVDNSNLLEIISRIDPPSIQGNMLSLWAGDLGLNDNELDDIWDWMKDNASYAMKDASDYIINLSCVFSTEAGITQISMDNIPLELEFYFTKAYANGIEYISFYAE